MTKIYSAAEMLNWSESVKLIIAERLEQWEKLTETILTDDGTKWDSAYVDHHAFDNDLHDINPPEYRFLNRTNYEFNPSTVKVAAWHSVAGYCTPDQNRRYVAVINRLDAIAARYRSSGQEFGWSASLQEMAEGFGVTLITK